MMMNKNIIFIVFCLIGFKIFAQTNKFTSSPYSIFGLGVFNESNFGKINTLGKSAIAIPSSDFINSSNPAAFSSFNENSFLFTIGMKSQTETLEQNANSEKRINATFSGIALAFPISKNSGLGISLTPYTNVGYLFKDVEFEIEGSQETYLADIEGSGGLNNFQVNYGYKLMENLRIGISASYYFGKITDLETNYINRERLVIEIQNYYRGIQFKNGIQYDVNNTFSLGATVTFPTKLNGEQKRYIAVLGEEAIETNDDVEAFKLPFEVGIGFYKKLSPKVALNLDYRRSFWKSTNQHASFGDFVDQDNFGLGMEFIPKKNGITYSQRIQYRFGLNYDTGNVLVNKDRVKNYSVNLGLGLPLNKRTSSLIDINYSYGRKGELSNDLIQENYHMLNLSLDLEGFWFQKSKIN
ncbi:OmpP1/FadL family transporter [Aureivirga marina]|uniref:OmpP1/FadL family transporter n=1 Tax=Aureivirga marina TaxID=1182451 RepID=UPI0018C9A298|nr:outer membrane beta-barrel protein [Aureivirga marina]